MKLRLISEVFEQLDISDVEVKRSPGAVSYKFRDSKLKDSPAYLVTVELIEPPPALNSIVAAIEEYALNTLIEGKVVSAVIGLAVLKSRKSPISDREYDFPDYDVTNSNNPWFVYNKMLACIRDLFYAYGAPHFLEFSAYDPNMSPVYAAMVRTMRKKFPDMSYVPVYSDAGSEFFIKESLIEAFPDKTRDLVLSMGADVSELAAAKIAKIKRLKNLGRSSNPF